VLTTLDPGQSYQKQSKTEQTLYAYGNLTQSKVYHFGNFVTPARTFTNTFLSGTNYTSRHIYNRLVSSSVTDGVNNVTLATNSYDQTALTNRTGLREHDSANYGTGFTYDAYARPQQVTSPHGAVTTFTYQNSPPMKSMCPTNPGSYLREANHRAGVN